VTLKKHVNANHSITLKIFEEELNSPLRGEKWRNNLQKESKESN
jgi:hypothetical protein